MWPEGWTDWKEGFWNEYQERHGKTKTRWEKVMQIGGGMRGLGNGGSKRDAQFWTCIEIRHQ